MLTDLNTQELVGYIPIVTGVEPSTEEALLS